MKDKLTSYSPCNDKKKLAILSRLFSRNVILELAKKGKSDTLKSILIEGTDNLKLPKEASLNQVITFIYNLLADNYRTEYIYKNLITQKILLGKHSVNSATMLTEFRVGDAKADILLLNGTSHIYEIKSEYDNLDRIHKQLSQYQAFAEFVSVVTVDRHIDKLAQTIDDKVGLIVLTDRKTMRTIKKASSNLNSFQSELAFNSLRKIEYLEILKNSGLQIPDVPNTRIYKECLRLISELSPIHFHKKVVTSLKERDLSNLQKSFIKDSPSYLKAISVSNKLNKYEIENLYKSLDKKISYHLN